ncbi:hypothetical protein PFICI_11682 [Pestalotiopsis fici W106-1]|uniref:Xylanolytic transcriptional activator regulatory domain-containing protein n=1 Tax=Pestalotiopsis fici (strain W106-1 / CGMCC3.15140) TaxID=1229662 RepID=W3WR05_PESFW|nr:uncharacterized protein PFICI_11682 [Pestalotiopsis fici W106-1]ETS76295.1 hypothetical protein PFICI_11682 [Pestalotiopsis fici W106-1]
MLSLSQVLSTLSFLTAAASASTCGTHYQHDVVVYGGSSGGYAAAIQLSRLNRSVALIEPYSHIGGIAVDGFGASDIDSQAEYQNSLAVGPLALEFYRRISMRYGNVAAFDAAWFNHTKNKTLWRFESHVAESVLNDWISEEKIDVFLDTYLKQSGEAVIKEGTKVKSLITEQGHVFSGEVFIDATYEGDLLAASGVSTTIGRESAATFNETNGGVRVNTTFSQLTVDVDPYVTPGDPSSGLIPTVQPGELGAPGSGDKSLAAYVFRMCLTNDTSNMVPWTKPANYNASEYILWSRYVAAGGHILTPDPVVPGFKTDTIGSTTLGLGFDLPGRTLAWPEGNHSTRAQLLQELTDWQKGQLYFFANDPSMPNSTRSVWSSWGYAKDEFIDNDHFPRKLYVRDGRRMVKDDFIITARTAAYPAVEAPASDPIAVAFWPTDVHIARRIVKNGFVYDEGSIFKQGPAWQPFGISYQAVTPMRNETTNLMSPTVMAVSHLGYGAVRIENTFMNLGQAVAYAASVALEMRVDVQDVPYSVLGARLSAANAVLDATTVVAQRRLLSRSEPDQFSPPNHSSISPSLLSPPTARRDTINSPSRMNATTHITSPAEDATSPARPVREQVGTAFAQPDQNEHRLHREDTVHTSHDDDVSVEYSPAYLGSSSAVGFMSEVYQTFKSGNGGNSTNDNADVTAHDQNYAPWFGRAGSMEDSNSIMADFVVPPRKIADGLIHHYWEGAHPLQPFIHKGTFMKRYNELWQTDTADSGELHAFGRSKSVYTAQVFHCTLNLVFALGCRFRSMSSGRQRPGSDRTHEQFAHRATRLLSLDLMDYGSIQLVQALILMAQYLQTLNMSSKCWVIVGMAIRVAQGLALHLDVAGETQAQREERRRTWHSCELLDSVLSMTFGRPLMLELKSSTPLPAMIDDEHLATTPDADDGTQPSSTPARCAFFVSIIKLSHITAEILRLFYFSSPGASTRDRLTEDYPSLLRLDAALERWKEELPSYLRYENVQQESPSAADVFTRQAHLLHHRFLYGRVLLFRRVVVRMAAASVLQRPAPSGAEIQQVVTFTCIDKCIAAAQGLLDLIRCNLGTWFLPPTWYTVFVIYTTGTVFTVVLLTPSLRERLTVDQRQQLQQSWNQCVECLREYQRLGDSSASKCLSNLQRIYNREGIETRDAPPRPGGQPRNAPPPPSQAGQQGSSAQMTTGTNNAESAPTFWIPDLNEGQNFEWDVNEWAFNWTNDCIDWPGDFATLSRNEA